jgi:adenine-specific DNA methylase
MVNYVWFPHVRYCGSKLALSEWIRYVITNRIDTRKRGLAYLEPFAGTGIILATVRNDFQDIVANDIEPYAYVFSKYAVTGINDIDYPAIEAFLSKLNSKVDEESVAYKGRLWANENHGAFFAENNRSRIDWYADQISACESLSYNDKIVLFGLLLVAADKAACNIGKFTKPVKSELESARKRKPVYLPYPSYEFFRMRRPDLESKVFCGDALALLRTIPTESFDVIYSDPPYQSLSLYRRFYSVYNTIVSNLVPSEYQLDDTPPTPRNKLAYIEEYIKETLRIKRKGGVSVFSYSDEGSYLKEIDSMLRDLGAQRLEKQHSRYTTHPEYSKIRSRTAVYEYLYLL